MRVSCFDPRTERYEDVVCRRRGARTGYVVYLGDRIIGELFGPDRWDRWTAVSHADPSDLRGLRKVEGFGARWQAIEYLLDVGVRSGDPLTNVQVSVGLLSLLRQDEYRDAAVDALIAMIPKGL